jgi:trigger factor
LLQSHSIEVPETVVRRQLELRLRNLARSAIMQGVDPRSDEIDWKTIGQRERERATQDVQSMLLLQRIAEQESLAVSDEEIDAEIKRIASQQGESAVQLKGRLTKEGALDTMRLELKNRKALDFIVQAATVEREVVDGET